MGGAGGRVGGWGGGAARTHSSGHIACAHVFSFLFTGGRREEAPVTPRAAAARVVRRLHCGSSSEKSYLLAADAV